MITLHKLPPPPTHPPTAGYKLPIAATPPATATLIMQQLCSSFMFEQVTKRNASNQLLTHILQYVQSFTKYESKAILWQLHTVGPCSYPPYSLQGFITSSFTLTTRH